MGDLSRLGITRPRGREERHGNPVPRSLPGPSRSVSRGGSRRASRGASTHTHRHDRESQTSSNVEWIGTHINDLQHLSLLKIFSFLTKDELQTTRRVSRSWLQLINKEFGIKAIINNSNAELVSTSPWIVDVILINLTRPIQENDIAFASRLKTLQIMGMVVSYNLIPLLQSCTHLQSLTFCEPTIDLPENLIFRTFPGTIQLRELTKLTFESWNFTDSINVIARVLCAMTFGTLKSIFVRAVHPPVLPLAIIFTPFETVPEDASPMVRLIMQNLSSLEVVSLGTMISQSTFVFVPNTARPGEIIQLKELSVQNLYINWTPILEGQSQMTNMSIGHCQNQQWPTIRSCITRCVNQLEKVKVQGRTFGIPWDCDIFLECRNLKDLILNLTLSPKRGLVSLPNTLTTLSLDGPIERPEFLHLHNRNFSNLKTLQLNCLGLNFVILQLQQGQVNNAPPDQVDLLLFLGLIWHLSNLTELSFKDCSQDSLEWDKINVWCRKAVIQHQDPGLTFNVHNFEMHGQSIQHGLTLTLPPEFDRTKLNIPQLQVEGQAQVPAGRGGVIAVILRLLRIGN